MNTHGNTADFAPVIIRSARRQRVAFMIRQEDGRLVVLAPLCITETGIARVLERNCAVIDRLRRKFEQAAARRRRVTFTEGSEFLLQGKLYPLHFTCRVLAFKDGFYVPAGSEASTRAYLEVLYRRLALGLLGRKVRETAERFQLTFSRIRINGACGRWGSCSRGGNLNFSWRLILWPEPVIDYVVAHELAHLLELNHSDRFWREVARMCPKYRELNHFLRDHVPEFTAW